MGPHSSATQGAHFAALDCRDRCVGPAALRAPACATGRPCGHPGRRSGRTSDHQRLHGLSKVQRWCVSAGVSRTDGCNARGGAHVCSPATLRPFATLSPIALCGSVTSCFVSLGWQRTGARWGGRGRFARAPCRDACRVGWRSRRPLVPATSSPRILVQAAGSCWGLSVKRRRPAQCSVVNRGEAGPAAHAPCRKGQRAGQLFHPRGSPPANSPAHGAPADARRRR